MEIMLFDRKFKYTHAKVVKYYVSYLFNGVAGALSIF